jgi:integrase
MKAWDITEVRVLLRHTQNVDYPFYVLLLLAITHGLRVSEVTSLQKRDFIVVSGTWKLRCQRLKGSLETTQSLHHDADPLMSVDEVVPRFVQRLATDDRLFSWSRFQVDRLVKKYCHAVGIGTDVRDNRDHIHCAKHTLGVLLAAANRPILEIAKALGHKNINSSAVYCGTTDERADKARDAAFAAAAGN